MDRVSTRSIANSWASNPARRRNMQANRSPNPNSTSVARSTGLASGTESPSHPNRVFPPGGHRLHPGARSRVHRRLPLVWHGCPEHGRSTFNHNAEYSPAKIAANVARDADTNPRLVAAGWHVLRYWEHEDTADVVEEIRRLVLALRSSPR